jgi:hypothetical protein
MDTKAAAVDVHLGPGIGRLPESLQERITRLETAAQQTGLTAYLRPMTPAHLSWRTLGFSGYSEVYEFELRGGSQYLLSEAYFMYPSKTELWYLTIYGELTIEKSEKLENALGLKVNARWNGDSGPLVLKGSAPLRRVKTAGVKRRFVYVGLETVPEGFHSQVL